MWSDELHTIHHTIQPTVPHYTTQQTIQHNKHLLLEELLEGIDTGSVDLGVQTVGVVELATVGERGVGLVRDAHGHLRVWVRRGKLRVVRN